MAERARARPSAARAASETRDAHNRSRECLSRRTCYIDGASLSRKCARGRRPLLPRRRTGCIVRGALAARKRERGGEGNCVGKRALASGVVLVVLVVCRDYARSIDVRGEKGEKRRRKKERSEVARISESPNENGARQAKERERERDLPKDSRAQRLDSTRLDSTRDTRLRSTSGRDARRDLSREFVVPRRA